MGKRKENEYIYPRRWSWTELKAASSTPTMPFNPARDDREVYKEPHFNTRPCLDGCKKRKHGMSTGDCRGQSRERFVATFLSPRDCKASHLKTRLASMNGRKGDIIRRLPIQGCSRQAGGHSSSNRRLVLDPAILQNTAFGCLSRFDEWTA